MDKKLIKITQEIINLQANELPGEVSSKLNQARQKALTKSNKKLFFFTSWYLPATAFAAIALYFMMPNIQGVDNKQQISTHNSYAIIQDMELAEQYELMEDLEFYEWLSQQDDLTSI